MKTVKNVGRWGPDWTGIVRKPGETWRVPVDEIPSEKILTKGGWEILPEKPEKIVPQPSAGQPPASADTPPPASAGQPPASADEDKNGSSDEDSDSDKEDSEEEDSKTKEEQINVIGTLLKLGIDDVIDGVEKNNLPIEMVIETEKSLQNRKGLIKKLEAML